nr:MAG TPA: hypothetical protein [Caudoviricetes sp.]DAN43303.1 MAG TPA: hypothetical protein [Caudoviricetes sp.]
MLPTTKRLQECGTLLHPINLDYITLCLSTSI